MMDNPDRIEREIVLRAPRARVWRALTDAREFGEWFGVILSAPFTPGARIQAKVTTPGYEHVTFEVMVEQMQPDRYFSWRWHPHAVDPGADYTAEPTTLVEFRLEDVPAGTRLSVVESGFDKVPLSRRLSAYRENSQGWTEQMANIEKYVAAR